MICYSRSTQRMVNCDHIEDKPWIDSPLGRFRDGCTFNKVKVHLGEGHDYGSDGT